MRFLKFLEGENREGVYSRVCEIFKTILGMRIWRMIVLKDFHISRVERFLDKDIWRSRYPFKRYTYLKTNKVKYLSFYGNLHTHMGSNFEAFKNIKILWIVVQTFERFLHREIFWRKECVICTSKEFWGCYTLCKRKIPNLHNEVKIVFILGYFIIFLRKNSMSFLETEIWNIYHKVVLN